MSEGGSCEACCNSACDASIKALLPLLLGLAVSLIVSVALNFEGFKLTFDEFFLVASLVSPTSCLVLDMVKGDSVGDEEELVKGGGFNAKLKLRGSLIAIRAMSGKVNVLSEMKKQAKKRRMWGFGKGKRDVAPSA